MMNDPGELLRQLQARMGIRPDAMQRRTPPPNMPTIGPRRDGGLAAPERAPLRTADVVRTAADFTPAGDVLEAGRGIRNLLQGDAPAAGVALAGAIAPNALEWVARGGKQFIKAFHGSPYTFSKPSLSHAGAGEGTSLHMLNPAVYSTNLRQEGQAYRNLMSLKAPLVEGQPTRIPDVDEFDDFDELDPDMMRPEKEAAELLFAARRGSNPMSIYSGGKPSTADWGPYTDEHTKLARDVIQRRMVRPPGYTMTRTDEERMEVLRRADEALRTGRVQGNPGRLYELEVEADPARLVRLSRPVADQTPAVREALTRSPDPLLRDMSRANIGKDTPLSNVLKQVGQMDDYGVEGTTDALRESGLDTFIYNRVNPELGVGAPSRHILSLDDSKVNILRMLGLAGMAGVGGRSLTREDQRGPARPQ